MRIPVNKTKLLLVVGLGLIACLQSCKKELGVTTNSKLLKAEAAADTGVTVSTYAGSTQGYTDGPVSSARFILASYLCMGPDSSLYVADNNRLRKIDKNGNVSTIAGGATVPPGGSTADGAGSQASFFQIESMTIAPTGQIYLTDGTYPFLRVVTPQGEVLTLGPRFGPNDVVISAAPDSTLYGSEADFAFSNQPVSIIRETIAGQFISSDDLVWNESVVSLSVDRNDAVYYLALTTSGIQLFKMTNNKIYSMASLAPASFTPALLARHVKANNRAQIGSVYYNGADDHLAVAADGTVYIAGQHQVWKVTPEGTLSMLAGSTDAGYMDGPAAQARFQQILAIELAQDDRVLYVSDNFRIRKIMLK